MGQPQGGGVEFAGAVFVGGVAQFDLLVNVGGYAGRDGRRFTGRSLAGGSRVGRPSARGSAHLNIPPLANVHSDVLQLRALS